MKLLLDTMVLWWIARDDPFLSAAAREGFMSPENEVYVSPVSVWELLVKEKLGKLPTGLPVDRLVASIRGNYDIVELPLTESAVYHVRKLPDIHRDPFDRLLICQALDNDMRLVTSDAEIRQYPVKTLW